MFLAFIAQAGQTGGGGFLGFLPFILILVIIYFLMLRPQMKRQKEHAAMISALQKNDEVVTSGGMHGRIIRVNEKDTTVQVMISKGVIVTVERSSVARKKDGKGPDKTAPPQDERRPQKSEPKQLDKIPAAKNAGNSQVGEGPGLITTGSESSAKRKPRPRRRPRRSPSQGSRPKGSDGQGGKPAEKSGQ